MRYKTNKAFLISDSASKKKTKEYIHSLVLVAMINLGLPRTMNRKPH